jgi:hypothetical protein
VDQGRVFKGLEDGFQVVVHRQYKTGRQLPHGPAGVDQTGGVGQKSQRSHGRLKGAGCFAHGCTRVKHPVGLCHRPGHPVKQLLRSFNNMALIVPGQVALFQNGPGNRGQFQIRHILIPDNIFLRLSIPHPPAARTAKTMASKAPLKGIVNNHFIAYDN